MASTSALAPPLLRSNTQVSRKDDPSSRAPSPGSQLLDRHEAEDLYTTGVYADPKPVKHWGIGQALFTPAHKKLLTRFREECGRLHAHNKDLRERASGLDRKLKGLHGSIERLESANFDLRGRMVDKNERLRLLGEELKEAQQSLAEMDAVFAGNRSKRLSRMAAKTFEISAEDKAALASMA